MSGAWLFQGSPEYQDTKSAVAALERTTWLVNQYAGAIEAGDRVYLWETGPSAGVVAVCTVEDAPAVRDALAGESNFYVQPDRFLGAQMRVVLAITHLVDPPVTRAMCQSDTVLATLPNLRFGNATNFRLTEDQSTALDSLIGAVQAPWDLDPGDVVKRSVLHDRYGGSRQGGIAPSARTPNLFLFTDSASGHPHGYVYDGWADDSRTTFRYTGEGQIGHQSLDRGNGKLLRHRELGLAVRLFEAAERSYVRYVGRFEVDHAVPYTIEEARQSNSETLRNVVVFNLHPQGEERAPDATEFDQVWTALRTHLTDNGRWRSLVHDREYELIEFDDDRISYLRVGTGRPDVISRAELRNVWQAVRASGREGHVPATSSRSALLALHPNIEVARGSRRLFYVGSPSHPLGLPLEREESLDELARLADALCLDEHFVRDFHWLLNDRGQIVFYGPPGTGKTFVAERFARWFAGDTHVETVQFHASYAYEDFMEGIRPVLGEGDLRYELVDGIFKRMAQRAADDPDGRYVLVIDEINRANLARVFGELLYLLEYRERAITLPYSASTFKLPTNLYLIGTMNTADRSIALVDFALRRRFHFVHFPADATILRRWLSVERKTMVEVADLLAHVNRQIGRQDFAIGFSYFMRRDLDEETLVRVWRGSVMPAIAEYYSNDPARAESFSLTNVREAIRVRRGDAEAESAAGQ